jgi:hypothetical protein
MAFQWIMMMMIMMIIIIIIIIIMESRDTNGWRGFGKQA